jgi:cell division protein FtsI/penicillin-binding protein 2
MIRVRRRSRGLDLLLVLAILAGCATDQPDPTPIPSAVPVAPLDRAPATMTAFLQAWRTANWDVMYRMLAAEDQARVSEREFRTLLVDFRRLAGVTEMTWTLDQPERVVLPAAPRPPDLPPPTPTPLPSPDPSAQATPTGTPQPTPAGTPVPPETPLDGPRLGLQASVTLDVTTELFGEVTLDRELQLVASQDGWKVLWRPEVLFPELGDGGRFRLRREVANRGSIVAQDGTVYARTRDDGARVYPQDWLAGQTIGYATPATPEDVRRGQRLGLRRGDLVGRSGLEQGADALLAGTPGFVLQAVSAEGDAVAVLRREMVPGADVIITLRRDVQATADAVIAGYNEAGTAVIDPRTGDVWALSSAPLFNPNAMTIGTTMSGSPLAFPSAAAQLNHATLAAYPAGSSFKVFTLGAALKTGVASPATRMTCSGTWTYSGFTFQNYEKHTLPGSVDLLQAMAFSCNTTYMPLSINVYQHDQHALTDLVREFGFGQSTGIKHLADEPGILPDREYFRHAKRWDGEIHPYGPFDQIQLAIGQGSYLGTPLQLANAYAAIGNGGKLWTPRIVAAARLPDGTVVERNRKQLTRRISMSRGDLGYVVQSMRAVVTYSYGTAFPAFAGYGIPVAGKSGTAETGGPDPDAWFPAIAPANDPRIAVATVLVRVPLATGGSDAAPLVRRVMSTYFGG